MIDPPHSSSRMRSPYTKVNDSNITDKMNLNSEILPALK